MYTKKRILKDRGIVILAIVIIIAICSLACGIMFSKGGKDSNISDIAKLDETEEQKADAKVKKETTSAKETQADTTITQETTSSVTQTTKVPQTTQSPTQSPAEEDTHSVNAPASSLSFTANSVLVWPVETNDIIIDFSMDTTTYFATLDMYKTSDAICIRSDVGSPVYAAADGIITSKSYHEEIGHFISMDLGDHYELTYGQLKDVQVEDGDIISVGDLIGYVSEPTKYYSVEGANLYLKLTCDGVPSDPSDYLNYDTE